MIILGIDPALNRTGWGVIKLKQANELQYVASGIIDVAKHKNLYDKIKYLAEEIDNIIIHYQAIEIALEETFVNKNPATSLKLGQARGAIMVSCLKHHNKIFEYSTNLIKKSVSGMGKADKVQIAAMIKILLPKANFTYHDESDALAVAITHAQLRKMQQL